MISWWRSRAVWLLLFLLFVPRPGAAGIRELEQTQEELRANLVQQQARVRDTEAVVRSMDEVLAGMEPAIEVLTINLMRGAAAFPSGTSAEEIRRQQTEWRETLVMVAPRIKSAKENRAKAMVALEEARQVEAQGRQALRESEATLAQARGVAKSLEGVIERLEVASEPTLEAKHSEERRRAFDPEGMKQEAARLRSEGKLLPAFRLETRARHLQTAAKTTAIPSQPGKLTHGGEFVWRAAHLGDATAQLSLADCFSYGYSGFPRSSSEQLRWLRRAAEAGQVVALFRMGYHSETGKLLPKDLVAARSWYRKAAAKGYKLAREALERLEK